MSKDLGFRTATTSKPASGSNNPFGQGLWVGQITPSVWGVVPAEFEVYHMTVRGPTLSSLEVWIDQSFYSTTPRGDLNEWDPKQPMFLRRGQTLYFYWNSAGNTANGGSPMVNVYIRERAVL